MKSIINLWNALTRLVGSVTALADTLDEANGRAREALGYEPGAEIVTVEAAHHTPKVNGRKQLASGKASRNA